MDREGVVMANLQSQEADVLHIIQSADFGVYQRIQALEQVEQEGQLFGEAALR
jgi:hypothetical protein